MKLDRKKHKGGKDTSPTVDSSSSREETLVSRLDRRRKGTEAAELLFFCSNSVFKGMRRVGPVRQRNQQQQVSGRVCTSSLFVDFFFLLFYK